MYCSRTDHHETQRYTILQAIKKKIRYILYELLIIVYTVVLYGQTGGRNEIHLSQHPLEQIKYSVRRTSANFPIQNLLICTIQNIGKQYIGTTIVEEIRYYINDCV